jgi:hypothetical protein
MKSEQKIKYIGMIIFGIIIGYFLFSGTAQTQSIVSSGGTCSNGITTSTPTDEGDRICTKVCLPKPNNCPRNCPIGTHWQCSGTLAMNCGCYPDTPTGGSVIETDTTGPRGCIENPSICGADYYCDTGINQCKAIGVM